MGIARGGGQVYNFFLPLNGRLGGSMPELRWREDANPASAGNIYLPTDPMLRVRRFRSVRNARTLVFPPCHQLDRG